MPNQAEANLSALLESTEDLIWSVDLDYRLITYNQALRQHIQNNYGVQIAARMRFHELLLPERAVLWPPFYARALSQGPFWVEYSLLDGHTLELSFNPITVDGKATGVSVFGKDITERKAAEKALQETEKKYRAIFDGALEGIFQTSPAGRFLSVNPFLARMLGYDSAEDICSLVTNAIEELWVDSGEHARFLREVEEQGAVRDFECRLRRRDGTAFWGSLCCRKVCAEDGQLLCYEGFIMDITGYKRAEQAYRESEEFLRESQKAAGLGSYLLDIRTGNWTSSEVLDAIFGIGGDYPHDVAGWTSLIHPDDRAMMADYLAGEVVGKGRNFKKEYRIVRQSDRVVRWVYGVGRLEFDAQQKPLKMSGLIHDITERKLTEIQLRESEERYRTTFQASLDAININRLSDGRYIDCNQAFIDIVGYEREEVIGRTSLELGIWADPRDRQAMVNMVLRNLSCRGLEAQFKKKNGEVFWGQLSASVMEIDGVPCILSITRDLSPAKAAENTIRSLAYYDPLTGLPNRRLLFERLRQALDFGAQIGHWEALLLIDLDHFRLLNESFGYQAGGLVLQEVARRIAASAHEADIVARAGGNEYGVMLEDLSEVAEAATAQAEAVGKKILAAVGQPYLLGEHECLLSASIGITIFRDRQSSSDEILQQAVIALHQAKAAGGNTMRFFSPGLQAAVNARAALDEDLRQAIKKKQFLLYYQPQVERGRLTGAEALIRWDHLGRGLVLPDDFIPLAEETGLILSLGNWTMETACAQLASWAGRKETAHLEVAVNISALHFRQPEFVEQVLATLDRTGAHPKNLKLELTESILLENIEEVIAKMTELKSHGLSFSLDDFGTGYSSLAYLKRLPLDQLKIDRGFVRDMLADATSGAIARTILALGRAMGLSVVAEGVETEEQLDFLASLGCHSFQGYLFSRPLPLEEFETFQQGFAECFAPMRK